MNIYSMSPQEKDYTEKKKKIYGFREIHRNFMARTDLDLFF